MHLVPSFFKDFFKPKFSMGSLWDNKDRLRAAGLVARGEVVGVFNRGVNALWVDTQNNSALKKLIKIKGEERINRPISLTLELNQFIKAIDLDYISKEVRDFLSISEALKENFGSLCFIRAPLKKELINRIPKAAFCKDDKGVIWIQSWDPYGHIFTESFIKNILALGVKFPGVTSMNITGKPEVVNQDEAERFCLENKIPYYLKDPYPNPKLQGSYTIITLSEKGIELTRDGNIPGKYIQTILGFNFISNGSLPKSAKYPQLEFPEFMFEGLNSKGVRMAILLYLEDNEPAQINRHLKMIERYKK